jgi:exosortase sorting signal-containing protein
MTKFRIIPLSITALTVGLFLLSFTLSGNAQTLYSCAQPSEEDGGPFLLTVDLTGAFLTTTEITLAGETVNGCTGMAKDPTTGTCWMILNITEPETTNPRVLVTVDEETGVATLIGDTGNAFSTIAFDASGTLYGVTGDGASSNPETLFTLNKTTGMPTIVQALGNGDDGEAIAFNPQDGLLYHASGNGDLNQPDGMIFETVNLQNGIVTQIFLSGNNDGGEQTALVYRGNNLFFVAKDEELRQITANGFGFESFIADMDLRSKGLALDCGIPGFPSSITSIPTLSEWGLIAMAGILGIIGFIVIRKRQETA